jgi:ubiquinone/menaquinone biosynthesis C-methylase UbiE
MGSRPLRRAKLYDEWFAKAFPSGWEMLVLGRYLRVRGSLLDVGCGTGRHVLLFAERKFDVFGVDKDREFVEAAKIKLRRKKLGAGLMVADACTLPFRDGSFDYVISMGNTLGDVGVHRREREGILIEMQRVAKVGGILMVELVHRYWQPTDLLGWLWNYLATTFQKLLGKPVEYGDYTEVIRFDDSVEKLTFHAFTTGEARRLFEALGLSVKVERRGRLFHDWFFVMGKKRRHEP